MKNFSKQCFLFFVVLLSAACTHRLSIQKNRPFQLTETGKILVDRNWLETEVLVERFYPDTLNQDIAPQFAGADRDDLIYFSEDGTYRFEEGVTKHRDDNRQIFDEGTWRINEDARLLLLTSFGATTTYEIISASTDKLILKLSVSTENEAYAYHLIFKPIVDKL